MDDLTLLLRYATRLLLWLAPLEFLLGRAISRASRQMPAGDTGAAVLSAISSVGSFLVMPSFILVLLVLVAGAILGLRGPKTGRPGMGGPGWPPALAVAVLAFVACSVVLLSPDPAPALLVVYNAASALLVLGLVVWFVSWPSAGSALRVTVGLLGLSYAGYYTYALAALLAQYAGWPVGEFGVAANAFGEGVAMLAGISLLWTSGLLGGAAGRPGPRRLWLLLAGVAAAVVLVGPQFEEWLQGVATQFSVGFTLFLPVPVTALALAAWIYAVLAANSRDATRQTGQPWAWEIGGALLLLPAAGYQLQLNYQHLLLVATLLLLTGRLRPLSGLTTIVPLPGATRVVAPVPATEPGPAADM
ncbi:MAG TPA: hypothetical protein VM536_04910 [Chloroflexia bacterium]|nr:hypothetical protein [Chloroflexia bacterium]